MTSTFAERLKVAISDSGISQNKLAELVGCHKTLITKYLQGECKAKQVILNRLAIALDVSEAWLMGYDCERTRVEVLSPEANELLKIYNLLDGKNRIRLLSFAFALVEKEDG